jgi:hypothetical protein
MQVVLPSNGLAFPDATEAARDGQRPVDITCPEYWSGACAVATMWMIFMLYAACCGFG